MKNKLKVDYCKYCEPCLNCGHPAKSHHGFSNWPKKDWGCCHRYKECTCKKFKGSYKEYYTKSK